MFDIISREVTSCDLKDVVSKLIPDSMSLDIQVKSLSQFENLVDWKKARVTVALHLRVC